MKLPGEDCLAIVCADLHLSEHPPVARSAEKDWFRAMGRQLEELTALEERHKVPILCGGDLFDRYNPRPALVNFALAKLPKMYAVPGQHDLPCHNLEDLNKTAFQTMVQVGKTTPLIWTAPLEISVPGGRMIRVHGFPWGVPVKPLKDPKDHLLEIAVVHAYVWSSKQGTGYPGAPVSQSVKALAKKTRGYDVVVTGDNHIPFTSKIRENRHLCNVGGFFRRKMDEKDHKPSVGLILADGTIRRHHLDCSQDKFISTRQAAAMLEDHGGVQEFLAELEALGDTGINFPERLRRALESAEVPDGVRRVVLEALEENQR